MKDSSESSTNELESSSPEQIAAVLSRVRDMISDIMEDPSLPIHIKLKFQDIQQKSIRRSAQNGVRAPFSPINRKLQTI